MMSWLQEHVAAILGVAVVLWGLWGLREWWSQRNETPASADDPEEPGDPFTVFELELETGFLEVKRTVRGSMAVAKLVLGILTLTSGGLRDGTPPVGAAGRPSIISDTPRAYVGMPDTVEVQVGPDSEPVVGAPVVFLPMTDQGTVSPATAATDTAGRARTIWTLGSVAGEQRMVVQVLGGDSTWITAEAMPREEPVPDRIEISPDSAVLGFVGDVAPFSAEILDQYDDPFPGSVTWLSKQQCIFRAGSYGFATALSNGTDSIVAVFDTLRATASVRVDIGAR